MCMYRYMHVSNGIRIVHYIITTVKHAIWLVNSRAGSGYPARGIKMPSRDFRRILKMSLFHCSYFIKQLPNGFPSRIAWSMHLGCCSTFGKRTNTLTCGSSISSLRFPKLSRHPSCMDHAILHGKPFGIPLFLDKRIKVCVQQGFISHCWICSYLKNFMRLTHYSSKMWKMPQKCEKYRF
jgi:hypothetical protein